MHECEQFTAELDGLHPILDRDLARIEAIATRLRQLADEQRRDFTPDATYAAHKVFLWRRLDLHARRAEDKLGSGGWAQDALDAEEQELLSRILRPTDYDTALMTLSGEPLTEATSPEPARFGISLAQVVAGVIGLIVAGVVILLLAHGRIIPAVVIAIFALRILDRSKEEIFPSAGDLAQQRPDPDRACPGFTPYRIVLDAEIIALNGCFESLGSGSATPADIHRGIAVMLNSLAKLKRVTAPPVARSLHEMELRVVEGWLGIYQGGLNGEPVMDEWQRVGELEDEANTIMHELDARCLGS